MPGKRNDRKLYAILLIMIFITSCNSKDKKLERYYTNNTNLHQNLSDSLMNFSKKYKREITLKKTQFASQHIRMDISFPETAEWLPIFFDTSYTRHDYKEKTNEFQTNQPKTSGSVHGGVIGRAVEQHFKVVADRRALALLLARQPRVAVRAAP